MAYEWIRDYIPTDILLFWLMQEYNLTDSGESLVAWKNMNSSIFLTIARRNADRKTITYFIEQSGPEYTEEQMLSHPQLIRLMKLKTLL